MESLIDLGEDSISTKSQPNTGSPRLEVSFGGDVAAAVRSGQDAVTEAAEDSKQYADFFAGFEAVSPQTSASTPQVATDQPEGVCSAQQMATPQPNASPSKRQQQQGVEAQSASRSTCLKAAAERAARASDVLHQHSIEQGESNAKLRLLLATVAAKQVKARRMLADLSSDFSTALADSEHSGVQQLQELTARLQQAHQQVAAAQADAEQQRKAAAQQAEVTTLRENELKELRAELKALRKSETRHRREVQDLHDRLLESEAALSRLSGALPGAGKAPASTLESMSDDGSAAVDSTAPSPSRPAAVAADGDDTAGSLPHTPAGPSRRSSRVTGAGVGGSLGGVSVPTPDQAAVAQMKSWLTATQAALIEAQDDVLAREAEIKQLQQQVRQLQQQQQQQGSPQQEQGQGQDQEQQGGQEQMQEELGLAQAPSSQQQQGAEHLQEMQAAVEAAEAAAAAACAERQQLSSELTALRDELVELKSQLAAADTARSEAVAALDVLQQQAQQPREDADQHQQPDSSAHAADAAERAAAAEAELQQALAAAAQASAEVESLQQQLKELQRQQEAAQPASPGAAVAGAAAAGAAGSGGIMAGPGTPEQPTTAEGGGSTDPAAGSQDANREATAAAADAAAGKGQVSLGFELLQANSRIHMLQEELQDTQDSMRLLLKLVKKCAASAAGSVLKAGTGTAAAASALSGDEQQQMQRMLASVSDQDAAPVPDAGSADVDAVESKQAAAADAPAADVREELGWLHGLLHKLECRYSTPKQLQDAILRGREMEHLLCSALQRVHAIKAEAGGGPCACPPEADYLPPAKETTAAAPGSPDITAAREHADKHTGAVSAILPEGHFAGQLLQPQQIQEQQQLATHGLPLIDTLSAEANNFGPHSGSGWLQPGEAAGEGILSHESSTSAGGCSSYGGWDSWRSGSGGGAPFNGSCGGEALRPFSNSGAGAAAGSSCGGAGPGGLAPLADENLGYDGLDGAWWAKSSIDQPVTELPDFLVKKS